MSNSLNDKQLLVAREESRLYLANLMQKTNLKLATPLAFFEKSFNTSYEELGCVGYNPNSEELTAVIKIKRSSGYKGNLCSKGSHEYVRFYVNYGGGFEDVGYVGVNVHDIADTLDCSKLVEKPLEYAVRLKINPKQDSCAKPILPKVKAVLLWNTIPPANDPNLVQPGYVWGNVREAQIQIAPLKILKFPPIIGNLIEKSILNSHLSLKNLTLHNPFLEKNLADAKKMMVSDLVPFPQLVSEYDAVKANVEPQRMGFKFLSEAIETQNPTAIKNSTAVFSENKLDFTKALAALLASKGNVSYEEIGCVALDYHNEALVATFTAKKNYGYGGGLCTSGSKEYVTFWIQDESTKCQWVKLGTTIVNLHDIPGHEGLNYSAILPFDFSKFKTNCAEPRVLKIRAVLSWNVEPTGLDTPYWGNFKESYIQLQPKKWTGTKPAMLIVGGVTVDEIDNSSGKTVVGAKFEETQQPILSGSNFSGIITVHGVSAPYAGMKYRVKIQNLDSGASYYVTDPLALSGYDSSYNVVQHSIVPDAAGYYTYQSYNLNITSKLALFTPGTNNRLKIVIEHLNGETDEQIIQMDNTSPVANLTINDSGECVHYKKGGTILGNFSASDNAINHFSLGVSGGSFTTLKFEGVPQVIGAGEAHGIVRNFNVVNGYFEIKTALDKNCGSIFLAVQAKTIINSVVQASPVYASKMFCLKD